jgi:hypothetical protein
MGTAVVIMCSSCVDCVAVACCLLVPEHIEL